MFPKHHISNLVMPTIINIIVSLFTILHSFVIVRSAFDGSSEHSNLTEKYCHQQGCSGGVGGGRQQEGDPGGKGEHAGGDEEDVDILHVSADQMNVQTNNRIEVISAIA